MGEAGVRGPGAEGSGRRQRLSVPRGNKGKNGEGPQVPLSLWPQENTDEKKNLRVCKISELV